MAKVIAIANQKGGVGKTSTAVNLGAGLVRHGKDVLLIDLDAQANLTMALGFQEPDELQKDGSVEEYRYITTMWTMDDRICDGSLESSPCRPLQYARCICRWATIGKDAHDKPSG